MGYIYKHLTAARKLRFYAKNIEQCSCEEKKKLHFCIKFLTHFQNFDSNIILFDWSYMQLEFFQLDRLKRLIKCQISTTHTQKKKKTEKTQKKSFQKVSSWKA